MRDPAERLRDILEAIAALDRYANRNKNPLGIFARLLPHNHWSDTV